MIADDLLSYLLVVVASISAVAMIAVALSIVYELGEWVWRRFFRCGM